MPKIIRGKVVMDFGAMSTSLLPEVAAKYTDPETGCCFLAIYLPPNAPGLYVGPHSKVPEENEVILPFGSVFDVIKQTPRGLIMIYRMNVGSASLSKGRMNAFMSHMSDRDRAIQEQQDAMAARMEARIKARKSRAAN